MRALSAVFSVALLGAAFVGLRTMRRPDARTAHTTASSAIPQTVVATQVARPVSARQKPRPEAGSGKTVPASVRAASPTRPQPYSVVEVPGNPGPHGVNYYQLIVRNGY